MSTALIDEKGAGIKGGYRGSTAAAAGRHPATFLVRSGRAFLGEKFSLLPGLLVPKLIG